MNATNALRMPNGWRAEKENGQWRLEQWRNGEWARAAWIDSPIVSMFLDDMAAECIANGHCGCIYGPDVQPNAVAQRAPACGRSGAAESSTALVIAEK